MASDPRTTPYELAATELAALDASYAPIRDFVDWSAGVSVDTGVWDRYLTRLEAVRADVPGELAKGALDAAIRTAAFNTGAIEGLHPPDRGLTITLATLAADWQAEVTRAQGPETLELVEAAIAGYELALDLATGNTPVSEAILRRIHEVVSGPQATYTVRTPVGDQDQPLPKGRYKEQPNHVRQRDGSLHAYAPVDRTADEMRRLVEELHADAFLDAHPVAQAAYAHHALTQIHPFADGNGRVARVLASVYLLRAASIPLVVFADRTREYYDALEAADGGDPEPIVRFVEDRAVDTLAIAADLLGEAQVRSTHDLNQLASRLPGPPPPTPPELDAAAFRLCDLAAEAVEAAFESTGVHGLHIRREDTIIRLGEFAIPRDGRVRAPEGEGAYGNWREFVVSHRSVVRFGLACFVANDPGSDTPFIIDVHTAHTDAGSGTRISTRLDGFEARLADVLPSPTVALGIRLDTFGRRVATQVAAVLLGELEADPEGAPTKTGE